MSPTFPAPSTGADVVNRNQQVLSSMARDLQLRPDSAVTPRQARDIREQSAHFFAAPQDFSIEPWPHGGLNE
jgi:hypothetical protein